MRHFSFLIFLIVFAASNAGAPTDDDAFVAFVKGTHNFDQFCSGKGFRNGEYSKQKYTAHLGVLCFLRGNWQCANIGNNFNAHEREECEKFRRYLDILYEYLFREYAGLPAVKPIFGISLQKYGKVGPLTHVVNSLARISKFFFNPTFGWRRNYYYKLERLFRSYVEPTLLNEARLNYYAHGAKVDNAEVTQKEMILQMAFGSARNKVMEGGAYRKNFEQKLREMLAKAEETEKEWVEKSGGESSSGDTNAAAQLDKHDIILDSIFDDTMTSIEDDTFLEVLKGRRNFEQFCRKLEGVSNRKIVPSHLKSDDVNEYLAQKFEAHFGLVHLMRENWHCAKIGEHFAENERRECHKYRKYLDILYEYLFRLYIEAENPGVAKQLPAVKPIFGIDGKIFRRIKSLKEVVEKLSVISQFYWRDGENYGFKLEKFFMNWLEPMLLNEGQLNYGTDGGGNSSKNNQKMVAKQQHKSAEKPAKSANEALRRAFDQKLEGMFQAAKANAETERAKIILGESMKGINEAIFWEEKTLAYEEKFGTFLSSPFYGDT